MESAAARCAVRQSLRRDWNSWRHHRPNAQILPSLLSYSKQNIHHCGDETKGPRWCRNAERPEGIPHVTSVEEVN